MDTCQDSSKEIIYKSKNRGCCGIDRSCYRDKERRNCILDIREEISDRLKRRTDAVPDAKKVFDARSDLIPRSSEPTKKYICHTTNNIQNVTEPIDDKIPDDCKNALDTILALLPVSRKQVDKHIKNA